MPGTKRGRTADEPRSKRHMGRAEKLEFIHVLPLMAKLQKVG